MPIRVVEEGPPKRSTVPHLEGDWTMGDPELGAIERECERQLAENPNSPLANYPFLEVGIYLGRTTVLLAQIGRTVAVDWFGGNADQTTPDRRDSKTDRTATGWDPKRQFGYLIDNLRSIPGVYANTTLIVADSGEVMRDLLPAQQFLVVLLDADKSTRALERDIPLAWELVAPGGTLFMDDMLARTVDEPEQGTTIRAWEKFVADAGLPPEMATVDTIGVERDGTTPKLGRVRKPR